MQAIYIRPRYLPQLQDSAASQEQHSVQNFADTALKAAAGFWFLAALIGPWTFLYYICRLLWPLDAYGKFPRLQQEHLSSEDVRRHVHVAAPQEAMK